MTEVDSGTLDLRPETRYLIASMGERREARMAG
jgi:hypothetical protein